MPKPPGPVRALLAVVVLSTVPVTAQQAPDLLLLAHSPDLPLIEANDNRRPAGALDGGVLVVDLDVVEGDWRVETPDRPGLRVVAVAEAGGPPMIPAPLLRVGEGARVRARVRNRLGAGPVTVFGLHARPSEAVEGFVVEAGETGTVEFEAGAPGTYMYWVREGRQTTWDSVPRFPDRSQAAGAFVVDPAGGSPPDRIMVLSIWGQPVVESGDTTYLEALTINGLSWPYTERFPMSVGDSVRWRVVNASDRNHPMHLHGFFYRVLARGTAVRDSLYAPEDRRLVVTEPMLRKTTMTMEWAPTRPGRWLFHCHLSFHVTPEIRLPGAREMDPRDAHVHMAGLVVGIDVAPGPSDLVRRGPSRAVDLFAGEYGAVPGFRYGFTLDGEAPADSLTEVPGPPLFFHQYEAVDVTVHNRMSVPTGVHWHGLELDAWADGVPGWSASDGRVSPVIEPGQSFTYRLSLMRPGTFIYHSHLDDIHQLTGGLYGALIVLPEGEVFDARTDHIALFGWNTPEASELADLELNGRRVQPPGRAVVGERHRFRVINIAPAGMITAVLYRDGVPVPITLHAKDGADLPLHQRVAVPALPRLGVGETADFTWTPTAPGTYELHIGYRPEASLVQHWEVTAAPGS